MTNSGCEFRMTNLEISRSMVHRPSHMSPPTATRHPSRALPATPSLVLAGCTVVPDSQLPDIPLTELGPRRSIALARPSVLAYAADPASYRAGAADLFSVIRQGLAVNVGEVYPLREAAAAHRALESGKTAGSILLDLS